MNILTHYARHTLLALVSCALYLASALPALELSEIPYPLTRDQADKTLSKDYSYALMADGSVRRTWQTGNKTIIIDFDTNSNEAILIGVTYTTPVSKKDGIEDAHALGKDKIAEGAKWDSPKDKAAKTLIADTFGLSNAKRKKLRDSGMLFYELNDKGTKVTRVSLFSRMPGNNRWVLDTVNPGGKKSAMGNSWSDDFIEAVYADEARRQATSATPTTPRPVTGNSAASSTASATASSETGASSTSAVTTPADTTPAVTPPTITRPKRDIGRRTAMGTRTGGSDNNTASESSSAATSSSAPRSRQQPTGGKKMVSEGRDAQTVLVSTLPPAPDFLKTFGVEEPEWWHYIALGILALIVIFMILRSITKAKNRAIQQQQFNKVLGGKPLRRR